MLLTFSKKFREHRKFPLIGFFEYRFRCGRSLEKIIAIAKKKGHRYLAVVRRNPFRMDFLDVKERNWIASFQIVKICGNGKGTIEMAEGEYAWLFEIDNFYAGEYSLEARKDRIRILDEKGDTIVEMVGKWNTLQK